MNTTNTPTLPGLDVQPDTTTAPKLTPAESRALDAINAYDAAHGYKPAVRELAAALSCYPSHAGRMLEALDAKGFIRRTKGRARGFVVLAADVA